MPLLPARAAQLQQMPLFGGLTEAALEVLLGDSREIAMPAGNFFFHEGDPGESFYGKMGSDHDFRLHSSYGRGLARDQAFVAKRRLIAGEPARAALSEAFR